MEDRISKSRAFFSFLLTAVSIASVVIWFYHLKWAINVMTYRPYGNLINNLVFGPGTLVCNVGLSVKFLTWLNTKLVGDKIEADYKKYI